MNIYDTANNLAREIKESEEYKGYAEVKEKISKNADKKAKLDEFEKMRYTIQLSAMQGKPEDNEQIKSLQEKYAALVSDTEIREYFEKEMKFNIMMADINKIISEAVKDII